MERAGVVDGVLRTPAIGKRGRLAVKVILIGQSGLVLAIPIVHLHLCLAVTRRRSGSLVRGL